ncbi:cytochrome bd ubiquinol oxidase subunit I [Flexistipes sinusarabici DSM 4947]|uniref:Cytochrome bd ubiquinol oxidase subunit I n=2 Tax=Flexistipes sinusarabici TaxID=2352 RepID=F8E8X6_FLESM|nr:cytochrome ubiquinol oxidase subunit I [Flexistipes sinusarabici]AEI14100.1 cytochrome bd ubiquinol oxidase subunit I [Flexistipes sinusarabici DSM 4947]
MDALMLARLQFAMTAMFHFIFVPLTLGLSVLVAIMETMYVKTGNETYLRMTKFWGKLFLINFALGVVTGITMEFQFGMNWAEYSKYVGDIFGAPLAIEATMAFFLESTFLGVWIFGWKKISKKAHAFAIWMVAIGSNLSALWILIANAWMQHPVGYVIRNNRAELNDFSEVIFSPYAWLKFFHTVMGGYIVGAFFVMGVAAYHILKKNQLDFFKKSFKIAAVFGLVISIGIAVIGDFHAKEVAKTQPSKMAAMESLWQTQENAPIYMFAWPDAENEQNAFEFLLIPGLLSYLAHGDFNAEVTGLKDIPRNERPPVWPTFLTFRLMVCLGFIFIVLSLLAFIYSKKDSLENKRWFLKLMLYAIPLPYIAAQLGWIVAEIGRQPWIVYGVMKTSDAVSKSVTAGQVWMSLIGFFIFYGILAVVDLFLLTKFSKKGPEPEKTA